MRPLFFSKYTHETRSCVLIQKIFILKIILHIKHEPERVLANTYRRRKRNDFYICRYNDRCNSRRHLRCNMVQGGNKEN